MPGPSGRLGRFPEDLMAYRLYCLECDRVVGESAEEADVSRDRVEVCQACVQHGGARAKRSAPDSAARETDLSRTPGT